jgi:hypothetical protein
MGKLIAICLALTLQFSGLIGAHFYYTANPRNVLIVVDSSYGLNAYQSVINDWIESYTESRRYCDFHFATDKSYLGKGVANKDKLFRVNFGKIDPTLLERNYPARKYDDRLLLTFNNVNPDGWEVVNFKQ